MPLKPVGGSSDAPELKVGDIQSTIAGGSQKSGENTRDNPIIVSARASGASQDWHYETKVALYVNGDFADINGDVTADQQESTSLITVSAMVPAGGTYRAYAMRGNLQVVTEQEIYVSTDNE